MRGIRNPVTSRSATKASEERAPRVGVGIDDCGGRDHTTALASPFYAGREHPTMHMSSFFWQMSQEVEDVSAYIRRKKNDQKTVNVLMQKI